VCKKWFFNFILQLPCEYTIIFRKKRLIRLFFIKNKLTLGWYANKKKVEAVPYSNFYLFVLQYILAEKQLFDLLNLLTEQLLGIHQIRDCFA
jgi:hypothetical protein